MNWRCCWNQPTGSGPRPWRSLNGVSAGCVCLSLANPGFPRTSQGDGKSKSSCLSSLLEVISCLLSSSRVYCKGTGKKTKMSPASALLNTSNWTGAEFEALWEEAAWKWITQCCGARGIKPFLLSLCFITSTEPYYFTVTAQPAVIFLVCLNLITFCGMWKLVHVWGFPNRI